MTSYPARRLLIVSHRLPISVSRANGELQVNRSSGGLAAGPVCVHQGGDSLWIGWPGHAETLTEAEAATLKQAYVDSRWKRRTAARAVLKSLIGRSNDW